MKSLTFVTGNELKVRMAQAVLDDFKIKVEQKRLDITEIQADSGETVARDKAQKAFDILQQPLVVCDDSWLIPGLHGFPGPYMAAMQQWLTAEDWLRLTLPLADRRIILRQIAVYQDAEQQKCFAVDIEGLLLKEVRGDVTHNTHDPVISFDGGHHSAAEIHAAGRAAAAHHATTWHQLGAWLAEQS